MISLLSSLHHDIGASCCRYRATETKKEGQMVPWTIAGMPMIEQRFQVKDKVLTMLAPADVDAVMDYYIEQGEQRSTCQLCIACQQCHRGSCNRSCIGTGPAVGEQWPNAPAQQWVHHHWNSSNIVKAVALRSC